MKASRASVTAGQPDQIPPLSQSRHADMACQALYIHKHVLGGPIAETGPAARGIEVHQVLAIYINHLVRTRRSTDLEVFDTLMRGASAEAREVLDKLRDNHAFDPERVLATELHIALDEDFRPIGDPASGQDHPEKEETQSAAYEGTLDLVLLNSITEAEIDDWKSYYQVIDADTFQSKFYPLLLMCLNPSLERVRFVLEFVRYGVSRFVEYTRADLPWMKELSQRERGRQRRLHELAPFTGEKPKASPGRHCTWCPLLLNGCPVAETNPYEQMTPEERLRFALWLQEAEKYNTRVLRDLMVARGTVRYRDENQSEYVADFVPVEKKFYPYRDAAFVLDEWFRTHPEDSALVGKLTVSGLSSALKAEKRSELAQSLAAVAEVRVDTELKIGRAKE
jgi:hypothetical protein